MATFAAYQGYQAAFNGANQGLGNLSVVDKVAADMVCQIIN